MKKPKNPTDGGIIDAALVTDHVGEIRTRESAIIAHVSYAEAKLIDLQKNFGEGSASHHQCECIMAHLHDARALLGE